MKIKSLIIFGFFLFFSLFVFTSNSALAEDKSAPGGIIPKLQKTPNDPELFNNFVYPMWGPVCQRYTYTVTYRDKEGRPPEYMRIIFNGNSIDMEKAHPNDNDYKNGVRYEYKFVSNKIGSNFYYFEASNGVGKARASIIDSPDNGPVLFDDDFLDNEIALVDAKTGEKLLRYPTGEEWIGGIALSDDGKYLAAKTSYKIILFDTAKNEPLWLYTHGENPMMVGGDLKGGVDISADGSKIIAAIGNSILSFDKSSNEPIWKYDIESNAYNVAISADGKYMAAATGGEESNLNSNLLILWNSDDPKPLWQYHASGNFHDVSLSDNGQYIAGSTGCPDRRFYLFSKDSNTPLIRSEMLTRDSPIHQAKISADGNLAAVGSESDRGAVFLFSKDSSKPVWEFPTLGRSSVRALNFTPDGKFIGAATFGGQVYIFEKESNQPAASWDFNAALGGIDIADDGSFIVVGGTDNKIHILSKDQTLPAGRQETKIEVPFEEYVEEIDISADGRYVAVGTGGSVYFFESIPGQEGKTYPCTTIIEPKPLGEMMQTVNMGGPASQKEEGLGQEVDKVETPGMLFGLSFLTSVVLIIFLTLVRKASFLSKIKNAFINFSHKGIVSKLNPSFRNIVFVLSLLAFIFLLLTILTVFINKQAPGFPKNIQTETSTLDNIDRPGSQEEYFKKEGRQQGVCGNNLCEPNLGENKQSCRQDCSAGD